jgi:choline kinase
MLHPVYFEDEFCIEIDTKEDLEMAGDLIGMAFNYYGGLS